VVKLPGRRFAGRSLPALVLALHGQLAPAAWAASRVAPDLRLGFVQTSGGALPDRPSPDVAELRERGLLCGHIATGPAEDGEREALGVAGAMQAGVERHGWEGIVVGPGPGDLDSGGGDGQRTMGVLESAHAALSLGLETLVCLSLSSSDARPQHRGLSDHSEAVLRLLLAPVRVPVPEAELAGWPTGEGGEGPAPLDALREACGDRHDVWVQPVELDAYAASGLPTSTAGRELGEDPLFFATALAAGAALAAVAQRKGAPR
jgi:hypothetical protein